MDNKPQHHKVPVIRIKAIDTHPNADNLEIVRLEGYQLVVGKGQFKVGDLAVQVYPDSIVPQAQPFAFLWEGHIGLDGTVPMKYRRVTVRKFRKEWSEGLLLPIREFAIDITSNDTEQIDAGLADGKGDFVTVTAGDDISELLGVIHYDPDVHASNAPTAGGVSVKGPKHKGRYPRSILGWIKFIWRALTGSGKLKVEDVPFHVPTYDVDALKNYKNAFDNLQGVDRAVLTDPVTVVVTEKVHGSNARFVYLDGEMYAGSRQLWKAKDSNCVWRKALKQNPWIEDWCKEHEGFALYGEVTPTQGGFSYGCKDGEVKFFWFDIYTPGKDWVDYDDYGTYGINEAIGKYMVPLLYYGPYNFEKISKLVDGTSIAAGGKHIREGVVIRTAREVSQRGLGRTQLKIVSNTFLEKDNK
jgi:RNA ligase (TIGR02306 family)